MDVLDEQIVQALEQDARQTSPALAGQLGVSSATVRRRVKKLVDSDTLRIVAYRNPTRAGLPVGVLVGFNLDRAQGKVAMARLRELPQVVWACTTTGRYDGFLFARFRSNEELASFLQEQIPSISGITDSETFVCLHIMKDGRLS